MTTSGSATSRPADRSSGTVEVDGLAVFHEVRGQGEPLVLLHGGMATNATWWAQIEGLSSTFEVLAPERAGHGHTPDRPGPFTYESMTAETIGYLEALRLGPVHLLGWSDGGMVGFRLAAERPDLVQTLTVTGAGFSSAGYVPGALEALIALPADDPEMAIFAGLYGEVSPDGPAHFPAVWEKVRAMWAEPFDWSELLGAVQAPTLVIVGDDDYITVGHAEAMAAGVAQGQLAVVPGASHLVPMEKPDLFNELVRGFIGAPRPQTLMPLRRRSG
jgi:pimeloyl-ACP methyl ester carboxylesterase